MEFHDREEELRRLKRIAEFEPHTIYFLFGPINSGKTALIQEFIRRLGEGYAVFYVNLREVYVKDAEDFLKVLFEVRGRDLKSLVKEIVEVVPGEISTPVGKIPIPKRLFKEFFGKHEYENVFMYLRRFLSDVSREKKPIFILDELQVIKDVEIDGKLIYKLFNLFVRLTKELHLCHVFCLTSDSLFVERIYNEAMLQGRADYLLIDDFDFETTKGFLKRYGFKEDEINTVWNHFGGKPVYLIKALENRENLEGFCEMMLRMRVGEIKGMLKRLKELGDRVTLLGKEYEVRYENVVKVLKTFKEVDSIKSEDVDEITKHYLIKNNVLFMNPIENVVKPQSRLDLLAIKRVLDDLGV